MLGLVIGGLYYTGLLPKAWDAVKDAGNHCSSAVAGIGYGAQSVCNGISSVLNGIDNGVQNAGSSIRELVGGFGDEMSDGWETSETRMSMEALNAQVQKSLSGFMGNGLTSNSSTLDSLMKMGPSNASFGGGEMGQMRGALDSFAIAQKLMGSQPQLGNQWLQKGASMGAFGLPSQLSLGNSYAASGNNNMALAYFGQANQSLSALRGSDSPAAKQMLGGMTVSPAQLQSQITAAIRQMKPH